MQGRKKLFSKQAFPFNFLMNLHCLSFFPHSEIMLHEYYPLGFSIKARCVSYEIIP